MPVHEKRNGRAHLIQHMRKKKMTKNQVDELVQDLVKCRSAHDLSREDVAREMKVSASTIYKWEKGRSSPTGLSRTAVEGFLKKHR
jgi:DNA-binding transcriptional regulator YiaG